MAEEQNLLVKETLIGRWLSSRITQAIGVFGVAFTLFQGLEPFLEFSRFLAYLANHWRELTRGFWESVASLINLDVPVWALDMMTAIVFIILFTSRSTHFAINRANKISKLISIYLLIEAELVFNYHQFGFEIKQFNSEIKQFELQPENTSNKIIDLFASIYEFVSLIIVVPFVLYLSLYPHIDSGYFLEECANCKESMSFLTNLNHLFAIIIAGIFSISYLYIVGIITEIILLYDILIVNARRVLFVLFCLIIINFVALHSTEIEDFIEKATQ